MDEHGFSIGGRGIGAGHPVYIIAEMSANHHQDFDQAVAIVRAAKDAGADAVKLQTYTADSLTIDSDGPHFRIEGTIWNGRKLYDLYREASTPWDWQPKLKEIAEGIGLELFSTPFDDAAVDFLEGMRVPAYKIASFENVDFSLMRRVARTGKPVILSTGMASLEEIEEAVSTLKGAGCSQIALLQCASAYPAPPEEMNLRTIGDLKERFRLPVGLSDHTLGIAVPVAAVPLGVSIIEKHLTLSRKAPGPDSAFSLEPHEFRAMAEAVRAAEKALGSVAYGPGVQEKKSLVFRRSLFVVQDMRAGEPFTDKNVRCIRPGYGLHPRHMPEILGKRAARPLVRGTPLSWDLVG